MKKKDKGEWTLKLMLADGSYLGGEVEHHESRSKGHYEQRDTWTYFAEQPVVIEIVRAELYQGSELKAMRQFPPDMPIALGSDIRFILNWSLIIGEDE